VPAIGFISFSIGMPGVTYKRYENLSSVADHFFRVVGKHTLKMGSKYAFNDFYEPMPLVGESGYIGFKSTETSIRFC
jgi:hypothetical protein